MIANLVDVFGMENHFNTLVCDHIKSIFSVTFLLELNIRFADPMSYNKIYRNIFQCSILTEENPEVMIALASDKNRFFAFLRQNSDGFFSLSSGRENSDWKKKNVNIMPPNTRSPDISVVGDKIASECNSIMALIFFFQCSMLGQYIYSGAVFHVTLNGSIYISVISPSGIIGFFRWYLDRRFFIMYIYLPILIRQHQFSISVHYV